MADRRIQRQAKQLCGLDIGGSDREGLLGLGDLHTRHTGHEPEGGFCPQIGIAELGSDPLINIDVGQKECLAVHRVPSPQTAIGLAGLADGVMNQRRAALFIDQNLDLRTFARAQQALPVGFHAAPEQVLGATFYEGSLGPKTLDQTLCLNESEGLANGRPRHAALKGQFVDRRSLLTDRPLAGLNSAAEKGSKLDIPGDCAAPEPGVTLVQFDHQTPILPLVEILNACIDRQLRVDLTPRDLRARKDRRLVFLTNLGVRSAGRAEMTDSAPRRSLREGLLWGDLEDMDRTTLCGTFCRSCGETTLCANTICPACGGDEVEHKPLSRDGVLWTYTMVRHRPPGNYQMPEPFRPFAMGLVDLPDGLKVLTRVEVEQDAIRIGMPLRFHPFVLRRDEAGAEVVAFDFKAA